jgi:c(7)-type cytochrome triheme protein
LNQTNITKRGRSWRYAMLLPLFFAMSCSDDTLSLFFDIPPPTPQEKAEAEAARQAAAAKAKADAEAAALGNTETGVVVEDEKELPEIESILNWEEAAEMLPKDDIDEIDWSAALREGIIKPRAEIGRRGNPKANLFKYDFYFAGPDSDSDAFFPHSAHTEWLTCESCHPAIFPYRETGMQIGEQYAIYMDQIFDGEFCGKCHGTVAFILDSCSRCHANM